MDKEITIPKMVFGLAVLLLISPLTHTIPIIGIGFVLYCILIFLMGIQNGFLTKDEHDQEVSSEEDIQSKSILILHRMGNSYKESEKIVNLALEQGLSSTKEIIQFGLNKLK